MSELTVTRRGEHLVAVKRVEAEAGHEALDRLRHEAELLQRVEHPGLISFVDLVDSSTGVELHTAYVGTDTWERTPPTEPSAVIDALAHLTATVADLHEVGVAHGALTPDHVLVANDRRPVLCGLGDSRPLDPATEADDLGALSLLVGRLARPLDGELADRLAALGRQAAAGELSARQLTGGLDNLAPASPPRSTPRRRRLAIVSVVSLLALALLSLLLRSTDGAESAALPAPPLTAPATSAPTTTPPTLIAPTTIPPATIPRTATTPTLTTPTVRTLPDTALRFEHEGRTYGLGRADDIAVLGDWDCDGVATPALLQTDTDTIAVFDRWPDPGAEIEAQLTASAPAAIGIEAAPTGDGSCHRLRVIDPAGSSYFVAEIP